MPQFRVRLPSGRVARFDFAYPNARLAIEADSYRYHSSLLDWSRDRVRHNELIALGWRVLPVTFSELRTDPIGVAHQVARCLRPTDV
jgi:very-short-patch-repair endonuclease